MYVLGDAGTDKAISALAIRSALGMIAGIAAVMLYNPKRARRPLIGGKGTGRFWPGVGWWLLGSTLGGAIGTLLTPGATAGIGALSTFSSSPAGTVAIAPTVTGRVRQ